jgi:replicative DNA helicase
MSDAEIRLVTKIIETGDLSGAIRAGVSLDMFANPIARDMFETISMYHHEREHYGCVPSVRWMEDRFTGTYRAFDIPETISELCVELRDNTMRHRIWELCDEILDLNETDPREAIAKMRTEVIRLSRMAPRNTERILAEDAEEIITRAELRRNASTIIGIPTPWDELNKVTQGIQQEDLIVLFGRPGSMKSWLAAEFVAHAYLHANARVLVYSCEMSTELFEDRVACAVHQLNYSDLKDGSLNELDWKWYKSSLRSLAADEKKEAVESRHRSIKFVSHLDDPRGGGVTHLMSKIEEFDADLVVVDSFYKMKDDRTGKRSVKWEAQYGLTQDLKGVTQIMHIPMIAVTQRHRSKGDENGDEELDDLAYADAVGQEAEGVYRIKKEHLLEDGLTTQLRIMMAKSRETTISGFILHVIPASQFKLYGWLNDRGKLTTSPLGVKAPREISNSRSSINTTNRGDGTSVGRPIQTRSTEQLKSSLPQRTA